MSIHGIGVRNLVLAGVLLLSSATVAHAGLITLIAHLTGDQVVPEPANPSPGTGDALLILDDTNLTLSSSVSFRGLASPTAPKPREGFQASAWIEQGAAGSVGQDLHPFLSAPFGVTQGSFTDLWTGLTANDITLLETGQTSISIYTQSYAGGEIRGQIFIIPEPPSLMLGAVALALLFGVARFRRRWFLASSDCSRPMATAWRDCS